MFIEGLDVNLHISKESQLQYGDELWMVGQGGVTPIREPQFMGFFHSFEDGKIQYMNSIDGLVSMSAKDMHVYPQTYNNWYVCKTEQDAKDVYRYLYTKWVGDNQYEIARQRYMYVSDRELDILDDLLEELFAKNKNAYSKNKTS